ncbi:hypothetical protein EUX98_g7715 [Antrodiella citrinella]|uniref:Uncharacterized protein n=1 Tax=Antrodiella citrinella TaxID=2447956 RepID=A0A4S4MMI7_9APHY|nr:hypothetical protein EUX98_g7715 [Antrodiella citrinella]
MFTWYPVLVPVYLAKYEGTINGETSSIIMVLEAYRKEGAHFLDISGMHTFFRAQELKAMKLLGKASIDENLRESLLPEPSQAIRSESVSRAGIDDELLSGGAKIQHRFREALNSLVTRKDAWTKYERFWKEQRQRTHLRPEDFDDPRILEYPGFESDNRHFSLGSFFREVVAAKITLALSKEDERFGRLMLPRVWITLSFRALTQPEGGYKIESDGVSQAHITFTLNVDRDRLAHLKMPIIINLLHADNLLGQIHATVVSSHTASSSRPPDTTEAEGPMKTLYVAIKWDEQDTPEEEARQSATMFMHYMMETVPWAAKWEEENSRI